MFYSHAEAKQADMQECLYVLVVEPCQLFTEVPESLGKTFIDEQRRIKLQIFADIE